MEQPDGVEIANTSLRIGMICGLLMQINEDACEELIKNEKGDFRYVAETQLVLKARRKLMGRI